MKTIIAGSRSITNFKVIEQAIKLSKFNITEVVSGGCYGPDLLGERWAKQNRIPIKRFNAHWDKHGKAAGPIRNKEMADYADALIAIWDGTSKGTLHMIREAEHKGLQVYITQLRQLTQVKLVPQTELSKMPQNAVDIQQFLR